MGDSMYSNPFTMDDMPMDLGNFTDALNWVRAVHASTP